MHSCVVIPEAVYREVVLEGGGRPGARAVSDAISAGWLLRQSVPESPLLILLRQSLDDGEAEAIALALANAPCLILLDEATARGAAGRLGLEVTGTLGLLLRAKRTGLVSRVRPLLEQLAAIGDYHIAADLVASVLKSEGE